MDVHIYKPGRDEGAFCVYGYRAAGFGEFADGADSAVNYEERGIEAGIIHATHIFNAMSPFGKHDAGAAGASLLDARVAAEIILDLKHVRRAMFELLMRAKSKYKIILVTDSIAAETDGASLKEGVYKLKDGTTAGSALTMIKAVENAVEKCDVGIIDAVNFASLNPARLLGIDNRTGSIEAGKDADIVVFDRDFNVKMTFVRGRIVYKRGKNVRDSWVYRK